MIIHVEFERGGIVVSGGPYRDETVERMSSDYVARSSRDHRAIRKVVNLSSDSENRRSIGKVA